MQIDIGQWVSKFRSRVNDSNLVVRVLAWRKMVVARWAGPGQDVPDTIYDALLWIEMPGSIGTDRWIVMCAFSPVDENEDRWRPTVWSSHEPNISRQFFDHPPTNRDVYGYTDNRYNDFFGVDPGSETNRQRMVLESHVLVDTWKATIGEQPERMFDRAGIDGPSDE